MAFEDRRNHGEEGLAGLAVVRGWQPSRLRDQKAEKGETNLWLSFLLILRAGPQPLRGRHLYSG